MSSVFTSHRDNLFAETCFRFQCNHIQSENCLHFCVCTAFFKTDFYCNFIIREWNREIERAQKRQRKPRLRNAMFRMFVPHFIVDGIECFTFILIR